MLSPFTRFLMPRDMRVFGILAAALLSMPFWIPFIGGYTDLAIRIAIFAIFALGFDILLGFTGYLSFGHAAFFGMSAYATALMFQNFSLNIVPAMFVGVVSAMALALVLGFITLRRSGIYFSILTLAFAEMMHRMAYSVLTGVTGGENGLRVDGVPHLFGLEMHGLPAFYVCIILLLILYVLVKRMSDSQVGLMLRAIKSNQTRLEYAGANLFYYKILAFVLSAGFAGLAGALIVVTEPYAGADLLRWTQSGKIVIMTVLGGTGTIIGPIFGAAFLEYFENIVSAYTDQWLLLLGATFMLVVIFVPGGIHDIGRRVRQLIQLSKDR